MSFVPKGPDDGAPGGAEAPAPKKRGPKPKGKKK